MKKTIFTLAILFATCVASISVSAQQTLPTSGGYYLIKNQNSSLYIGGNGTGIDAVKQENSSTNPLYHYFLITGDNTNGWTMQQVQSGLYITHELKKDGDSNGSWTGTYDVALDNYRQLFQFDNSTSNDYIIIKKKKSDGTFVNGIGNDNSSSNNQTIYFDQGTDKQNKWLFEEATNVETDVLVPQAQNALSALISQATALYGSGNGTNASALQTAITTAQGFTSSSSLNDINTAIADLQTAISAYIAANPGLGALSGLTFGTYYNSQTFDGLNALPSGWSCEQFGTVATCGDGKLKFQGSGNGFRGDCVKFPQSSGQYVYTEFDFFIGTGPAIDATNALFLSLTANTTWNADRIFELYCAGTDGKFHLSNLDMTNLALSGTGTSNSNYKYDNTYGTSTTTQTAVSFDRTSTYKIKALLDFSNHKILKLYIDDTLIGENLNFISPSANDAGKISLINGRSSGSTTMNISTCTLDNFEIGELIPTAATITGVAELMTLEDAEATANYTFNAYQPALGIDVSFVNATSNIDWEISDYNSISPDLVSITRDANYTQAILKTIDAVSTNTDITLKATFATQEATKTVTLKPVDVSALKANLSAEITLASALDDDVITNGIPYLTTIVNALNSAISIARGVHDNSEATALQINDAILALQSAENTFSTALANYNALVTLIATAQTAYTAETRTTATVLAAKAALQTAIDVANAARSTVSSSEDIADATAALQTALTAFNDAISYTEIAAFEGSDLFNSITIEYNESSAMSCNIVSNPAPSGLNSSANCLNIKCTSNDKWYLRDLLKGSSNTPINTSSNIYLHILIYSPATTKIVLKFQPSANISWDDLGNDDENPYTIQTGAWYDFVIDLSKVNYSAVSNLYGIFFAGHWDDDTNGFNYYVDDIVINNSATPRTCVPFIVDAPKTSSEYLGGYYNDIIFEDGGQLTIDQTNNTDGLKPYGVIKVNKTFDEGKWSSIGFPFAIDEVLCEDLVAANPEWSPVLLPYRSTPYEGDYYGDFWLKSYDYEKGFSYTEEIGAGNGYIIQFYEWYAGKKITFVSSDNALLPSVSNLSITNNYRLIANPGSSNLTLNAPDNDKYYYILDSDSEGNSEYDRLINNDAIIPPFEAIIAIEEAEASNLLYSINIANEITAIKPVPAIHDDPVTATHYYTLQGFEVRKPAENGIYLVKKVHRSGKEEIIKIYNSK